MLIANTPNQLSRLGAFNTLGGIYLGNQLISSDVTKIVITLLNAESLAALRIANARKWPKFLSQITFSNCQAPFTSSKHSFLL
jgi:hypothetical protein